MLPDSLLAWPMQALTILCAVRQVRVIVERLARRCGYDAVAAAMPAGDRRLLSHIQKEMLRKRRTQTKPGSEVSLANRHLESLIEAHHPGELTLYQ